MDEIKPTTTFKEGEKKIFILEDKVFLLISAIQELSAQIGRLASK